MISLFKAIPFGIILTIIVALFMGSGGGVGGTLNIRAFDVEIDMLSIDIRLYWSWILFLAGTGIAWALLLMMGD